MAKSNAARQTAGGKPAGSKRLEAIAGLKAAAPAELDRLIHERLRLGVVSALAVNPSLTFNELKGLLKTTDGNLSVHARKLEDAGYVQCTKSFEGRTPRTEYRLTAAGRRALEDYLEHMEALIRMTRG
ncbi:MAG TPA: transcriptional regulator [Gemmatimonadales bacterium]|nr:transcriptional regulator [Gemmatimonadales bacterium]